MHKPPTSRSIYDSLNAECSNNHGGRKRLAQYLLRHPFSLQKITWNATSKTVIYRSKRHHNTKRNFEIFKAPDFIAAALLHLPPKGQQMVRYYGVYSNKVRGRVANKTPSLITEITVSPIVTSRNQTSTIVNHQSEFLLIEPPAKRSARLMRPLWRDLILQVWGGDPLKCPCCAGTMKVMRPILRREEVKFFLQLHGLWEGLVCLPRPPPPPFDIETLRRIEPPWTAIKEWIPDEEPNLTWFNQPRQPQVHAFEDVDQSPTWQPKEVALDDGRVLVLDGQ
ncbi:MAG: transposase [Akkermansiaceae bacterium]